MVTPADLIRELTLTNKHLTKKNENLKIENHNLKVANDMLKNKAATDQAVINAALAIKDLETYNQALEDENQHLREQLEHCAERKRIDDELKVLKTEVESIDEELEKRFREMEIIEELDEQMKMLRQVGVQEAGQEVKHEAADKDTKGFGQGDAQEDFQPDTEHSLKDKNGMDDKQ